MQEQFRLELLLRLSAAQEENGLNTFIQKRTSTVPSTCHNHTVFCDGNHTVEEMAQAAWEAGFTDFGFSGHSRTQYSEGENYGVADETAYVAEVLRVRALFTGRMRIAVGMEQDYFSPVQNRAALDYLIAAVHEIHDDTGERHWPVDGAAACLADCRDTLFGGDSMALVRRFYALTVQNAQESHGDILAHFDLVCKNNLNGVFFDENSPTYRTIALEALDACAETGAIFEVNTGGMYRGYFNRAYPAPFLLRRLREKGARVMLSADAHCVEALTYGFVEAREMLRSIGFDTLTVLQNGVFVQKPLQTLL